MKEYIIKIADEPDITGGYALQEKAKELVRCKDCKHGQYEEWDNGECTDKTVYCDMYGIHKPDWFCADGERKQNDALSKLEENNDR